MKKILDIKLKTVVQSPTQSKLLLKWRELTKSYGVVYIPCSDAAPDPLYSLSTFELYSFVLGIEPPTASARLWSKDLRRKEITLPKSKGGWRILTLSRESPKGLIAQAKILTRLIGNETHLKIFLRSVDNSRYKVRQEPVNRCCCHRCCPSSRSRSLGSFPY